MNIWTCIKKLWYVLLQYIRDLIAMPEPEPEPEPEPHLLLVSIASKLIGTTEVGGDNQGEMVEKFQKAVDDIARGEPWCMAFVQYCIQEVEQTTKKISEVFPTEHVQTCWYKSPKTLRSKTPNPGYLILWGYKGTTSGHVGIVKEILDHEFILTIEGNTSPSDKTIDREGDGVYEKKRRWNGPTGSMEVLGFINPWSGLKSSD